MIGLFNAQSATKVISGLDITHQIACACSHTHTHTHTLDGGGGGEREKSDSLFIAPSHVVLSVGEALGEMNVNEPGSQILERQSSW